MNGKRGPFVLAEGSPLGPRRGVPTESPRGWRAASPALESLEERREQRVAKRPPHLSRWPQAKAAASSPMAVPASNRALAFFLSLYRSGELHERSKGGVPDQSI